jgi:hypothetical protein
MLCAVDDTEHVTCHEKSLVEPGWLGCSGPRAHMRVLMYGNQWPNNYLDCAHTVWNGSGLEDQTLSMPVTRM